MASDAVSLERLKAGDEAAFASVVREYQPRITTYLMRMLGDLQTAEDLSQDTFVRAFRALPKVDGDLKLSAWLFRIATNCALDALRRRKLIGWLPLLEHPGRETGDGLGETAAEAELVSLTLRRLRDAERAALLLHLHYGFSCAEASQILGVGENAFRQRLYRGRLAFKRIYVELERGGQVW